jgi:hypothetical protein
VSSWVGMRGRAWVRVDILRVGRAREQERWRDGPPSQLPRLFVLKKNSPVVPPPFAAGVAARLLVRPTERAWQPQAPGTGKAAWLCWGGLVEPAWLGSFRGHPGGDWRDGLSSGALGGAAKTRPTQDQRSTRRARD